MRHHGTESDFELTTIERLQTLGYGYVHGEELVREATEVLLLDRLRLFLRRRYPSLPDTSIEEALRQLSRPDGVDTLRRNLTFHEMLTKGVEVPVERDDGTIEYPLVYPIEWDDAEANDFLVVNQLSISGQNDRRPDIIVYVNGIPLVVFELKNPWSPQPTVEDALNQVAHYRNDIPQLFEFNALSVVSDGVTTLHGMWPSSTEWYAPWKSIDGQAVEPGTTGTMKTLVEGLFPKERLLAYVRNFIVFESAADKIVKKGAKYHQFFAVRLAVEKTLSTFAEDGKKIGVIWHTTGSGKSLSMAFLVGLLRKRRELENPTFVVQVDRNDLDNQLHDQFVAARSLVGEVKQAESVDHLRELLRTEGGEVIFTTIEKFRLKADLNEIAHPVLSDRKNVIVLADEAHRSQYGFKEGYARFLAEALPNAKRLGFTGTPVSFATADTVEVFGEYIHTYDILQSQEDKATVPIYYAPRLVRLHLNQTDIDGALAEIAAGAEEEELERKKSQWAALAKATGAKARVDEIATDLLKHFRERTATLTGKAMIVCMTRENCVRMYNALTALQDCPEIKIIMTGNLSKDPPEWSAAGHITTKAKRDAIKKRMIDPDDPLKIVIVCDMWLTGTDIPCLHTLYVDKPMTGHNLIQAISRVNRVFSDKPNGLIVDYIGIGDELREATGKYTKGGGRGDPAPDVREVALPLFLELLDDTRAILPQGIDYGGWRHLGRIELEDRYSLVYGFLAEEDERRDAYLDAEHNLSRAYILVQHLDECRPLADEIIFYQRVRQQLMKTVVTPGNGKKNLDAAVRDLVDESVESEGVVDIFATAGIKRADISILDDAFLQTFKDMPHENLRLKLLEKLLGDEITRRRVRNLRKAKSFQQMLEDTLAKYHNRLIDAAQVIKAMIEIKKEMDADARRASELGLEEEELAFYDAVADHVANVYDQAFLRDLIHQVVQAIKRNLKVDWTQPHRQDVKAGVISAVKLVLRRNKVEAKDFDKIIPFVMEQAEAMYAEWPNAA